MRFLNGESPHAVAGLLLLVTGALSCDLATDSPIDPPLANPNIIFILADDLGYGDLGCYGQTRIRTPNIDRLATDGMVFRQFYAGSTVCAPSRCVLMTGRHTGHAQVRGNRETKPMGQHPLSANTMTVARLLQASGYTTALIGKWGLGGPGSTGEPYRQGFDFFYGYLGQRHAHNYYPEFLFRNQQRVPLEGNRISEPRPDGAGVAVVRAQYSHDLFAQQALEFIDRSHDRPFFLYLPLTIPHANNEAKNEGMEVPSLEPYEGEEWPLPQKGIAAMISRMDKDIGRIMDRLRQYGIDQQTIVMFSSDNGPHREGGNDPDFFDSNGLLRGMKRDMYEGGIRVPMIVRWPERVQAGSATDHISYFGDLMATVAEIIGTDTPAGLDSISFLPTLVGELERQSEHRYLYWEFYLSRGGMKQALRMGSWKAVRTSAESALELYDLSDDLGETRDRAADFPDVAKQVEAAIDEAHRPSEIWSP